MVTRRIRRAALAFVLLLAPLGLLHVSPAGADSYHPRLSTGGCITGIADAYQGQPVCRVISNDTGFQNYSDGGVL